MCGGSAPAPAPPPPPPPPAPAVEKAPKGSSRRRRAADSATRSKQGAAGLLASGGLGSTDSSTLLSQAGSQITAKTLLGG